MNNDNNPKIVGMRLLQYVQVLYQNRAISTEDKNIMASYIQEGMSKGSFYNLNKKLFDILDTTTLPQIVEDMIEITF